MDEMDRSERRRPPVGRGPRGGLVLAVLLALSACNSKSDGMRDAGAPGAGETADAGPGSPPSGPSSGPSSGPRPAPLPGSGGADAALPQASDAAVPGGGSADAGTPGGGATGDADAGGSVLPDPGGGAPADGGMAASLMASVQTVFLVLLENNNWDHFLGNPSAPYLNGVLLPRAAWAQQYHANRHPSEPNYIWLVAGDSLGITDDAPPSTNHRAEPNHLAARLDAAGVSWREYAAGISGLACPLEDAGRYAVRHNPFVYFDDLTGGGDPHDPGCIAHNRPLTELLGPRGDLANDRVARFNFITPDKCDDGHDVCPPQFDNVRQTDDFLARLMPELLASPAYQRNGAVFITWDESEADGRTCPFADCPIGMLVLSPLGKGGNYSNALFYDHSSMLRTVQRILLGPRPAYLRGAADAADLSDFFLTAVAN